MLEELAVLWRPDMPIERNPEYLAKAREQTAVIEAALRGAEAAVAAWAKRARSEAHERCGAATSLRRSNRRINTFWSPPRAGSVP